MVGLKAKAKAIATQTFGENHEYVRLLFEKSEADGVSLSDLRSELAHGGVTLLFPALGSDGSSPLGQSTLNRALGRAQRGMAHFTVHDLRRTGATRLSEMGYNPDWIEKALNHKLRGVRGIYNRAEYGTQRRKMLQEWADSLDGLEGTAKAA